MIAAYYRLSQADETTDGREESNSIINQRTMIRTYITEHEDLSALPLTEFTDDGFSGTSTDRPAFQKMLNGIKNGEITCVIVKDFSRFARNYIEAGDYIEQLFPFLGVRFIAVTDGYDSEHLGNSDSKNMEMVIKNVINAAYSKDLSAKICASNQVKRNQRQYLGGLRPFGFLPDPKDHHKLIVDPVASQYVKRIFLLAAEGIVTSKIAHILQAENIPTPSAYLLETAAVKKNTQSWKQSHDVWDTQKVRSILQNEKYKGTFVAQKIIQTAPCSKHVVKNAPNRIVTVESAHAAIVEPEIFDAAQKILRKNAQRTKPQTLQYPLKGKVLCGGCGRNMSWDKRYDTYRCKNTVSNQDNLCVHERVLTETLLDTLRMTFLAQYDLLRNTVEEVRNREKQFLREKAMLEQVLTELNADKRRLSAKKVKTYENYAEGRMSREEFAACKQAFEEEYCRIETNIQKTNSAMDGLMKQGKLHCEFLERAVDLAERQDASNLPGTMLEEFVERVVVYKSNRVEIVWRFADEIEDILGKEI